LDDVARENGRRRLHQLSDSIMYTGDSLKITHILYLLNRLVCLSQPFQMITLRILLELYRDVFEAVVYL